MNKQPGPGYRILDASDLTDRPLEEFASAVLEGLSENPKQLSSRYLYDDRGSELFEQIMELPEYYPTRCETEIFETHATAITGGFSDQKFNLVDLGAGDGTKTLVLLRHLTSSKADVTYVPVDISESAMASLARELRTQLPDLAFEGLVAEYTTALRWLSTNSDSQRNLVLFLGSNIGNFDKARARAFLRRLWVALNHDDCLLIGFDLKKDIDILLHAYNDSNGVTAEFNLNLLARINRELGGHFDTSKFRHYSTYDVFSGAMESYLVSTEKQTVAVDAVHTTFSFKAWEPVHTEYSYKYLESDIASLAEDTGFVIDDSFHDAKQRFVSSRWRVVKN